MILREIEREGQNPVGGGGFAVSASIRKIYYIKVTSLKDIWRGAVNNQSVCLKVLRLVIEPDEEVRQRIRRVSMNNWTLCIDPDNL